MLLTRTFDSDSYARALESWDWLELSGKVPVLTSLFGDVFLQDREGYWFLDSIEGTRDKVAATRDELQAILDSEPGQDRYLLGSLVMDFVVSPNLAGQLHRQLKSGHQR